MAADYNQLLKELESRLDKFMELDRSRIEQTAALKAENAELKALLEERNKQLTDLERKLSVSLIGQGMASERAERLEGLKATIDAIASEVEECIALLGKKV